MIAGFLNRLGAHQINLRVIIGIRLGDMRHTKSDVMDTERNHATSCHDLAGK